MQLRIDSTDSPELIARVISAMYPGIAVGTLQLASAPQAIQHHTGSEAGTTGTPDAPNPSAPAVESEGIPHDPRIHAPGKGISKEGKWRRKNNVPDAEYDAIYQQLVALRNQSAPPAPPAAPAAPTTPPVAYVPPTTAQPSAPPPATPTAPPLTQQPPAPPAAPAAPTTPPPPANQAVINWVAVSNLMAEKMASGKINADTLDTIAKSLGVDKWVFLAPRDDLHAAVFANLQAYN